jgi:hypothetical protein
MCYFSNKNANIAAAQSLMEDSIAEKALFLD